MRYCGIVPARGLAQLAMVEEVREQDGRVALPAVFFEPATAQQVAAELLLLPEAVVGVGAPLEAPSVGAGRLCDQLLGQRGVAARPFDPELGRAAAELRGLGLFAPSAADAEGPVPAGSSHEAAIFETNPEGVFYALRSRRLPARRHPQGIRRRIDELERQHLVDDGGGLWNRRIEELEAAAAALCAYHYALDHAYWLGAADEGVLVLPGVTLPGRFSTDGVLEPVERVQLPPG